MIASKTRTTRYHGPRPLTTLLLCLARLSAPARTNLRNEACKYSHRGRYSARRIRSLSRQQRSPLSTTSTSASIPKRNTSAARTPSASRCCRTARASSSICTPRSRSTKSSSATTALKYERDSGDRLRRLSRDAPHRPHLHHRLLLLRQSRRDRPLRRHHVHAKIPSGHPWINTACEGDRRQRLVAQQRPVARRSREHGHQRLHPQRSGRCLERQVPRQEPTSATATPAGTGWSSTPSTTTTSRSTSATTSTSSDRARRPAARFLRPARRPRQGQETVRPGQRHARRPTSTTSANIPSKGRLQADRGAVLRHGAPERRHLRQPLRQRLPRSATGPASASARASTSSSSTKAATSGSATASPPPTAPTCGSTKAGPPT